MKRVYLLVLVFLLAASLAIAGTGPNEKSDSHSGRFFLTGNLGDLGGGDPGMAAARFLKGHGSYFNAAGSEDHSVKSVKTDALGQIHIKLQEKLRGLPVVGAEMIVHADATSGKVHAVNGRFVADRDVPRHASVRADDALARVAHDMNVPFWVILDSPQLTYVVNEKGTLFLAWSATVSYTDDDGEQIDRVFADATTGDLVYRQPKIYRALNRRTYSCNNGTSLPGTLRITEGGSLTGDAAIDSAHTNAGVTYNFYKSNFNRDSYNGSGATMTSSAHYSSRYNNAYWNGSQMVYGDGDGTTFIPLSEGLDVVAHELTHAVTENEANLTYSNESGALNEAWSDIMGASTEAWNAGGVSSNTWKIGEAVYTPGTSGDALRYMNNPTQDGSSYDYYPERYTGSSDNGGVHSNSGIANLAYYLLSQGGTHPRNKTSVVVPAIGIAKAEQIFYRALTTYMTSSTNFQGARNATAQAATDLYGATEAAAVQKAWDAVGVPGGTGGGGGGGVTTLSNGQTVSNLSGSTGSWAYYKITVPSGQSSLVVKISGGSGDCDLYVKFGSQPSSSSYDYRPYLNGNNETVNVSNPSAGDWYIGLNAYASYSGVSLQATYASSGGGGGGGTCTNYNGSLSGTGSTQYQPNGTYYHSSTSGTHKGTLTGPSSGADFDLYLLKWNGSSWSTVARSESSTANESITYSGTSGYYMWKVYSYSGSGSYSLCISHP
ncbi:MAG: M4 family metallopeptidase [Thermoanaerobaculia bacterium]